MPKQPQEARRIHLKLLSDLRNYISEHVDNEEWEQFKQRFREFLNPREQKQCKNLSDIFEKLEKRGKLKIGDYSNVKEILNDYDVKTCEMVEEAEEEIKKIVDDAGINSQGTVAAAATSGEPTVDTSVGKDSIIDISIYELTK